MVEKNTHTLFWKNIHKNMFEYPSASLENNASAKITMKTFMVLLEKYAPAR